MIGWIKLHRSLNEWGWKSDPNVLALWVHLLINANVEEAYFLGHKIERGSLATGLNSLSDKTGLSISQIRTCLEKLKKTGEIAIKTTQKFSIISITKFEQYQDNRTQNDKLLSTQNSTPHRTPIATNKEVKKKEERSIITLGDFELEHQEQSKTSLETDFEDFWKGWIPYDMDKGSKQNAKKFYKKSRKEIDHGTIIEKRDQYLAECHRFKRKTTHASTWLNPSATGRRGWADEYGNNNQTTIYADGNRNSADDRLRNRVNETARQIDDLLGY